jgi:hypothetical protein
MIARKKLLGGCVVLSCATMGLLTSGCAGTAAQPVTLKAAGASVSAAAPVAAKPVAQPAGGPPPVAVDIGECFAYRYSSMDHCNANDQVDCQKAVSDTDCGVPGNFVYTNAYCQYNDDTVYKYHAICQGYLNTGPIPQPQCPNGHSTGTWLQSGCDVGTCTINCNGYCPGGYCTGGAYNLCYWQYAPRCDCGVVTCPCTGPDCN